MGEASLTFVILVVKEASFEYLEPAWRPEGLQKKDYDLSGYPQAIRVIWAFPIWDADQVSWSEGELIVETDQGLRKNDNPSPKTTTTEVTVYGKLGMCAQGDWDAQGELQAQVDAGTLEWSDEDFSYRITQTGLGLSCEDLLRIVLGYSMLDLSLSRLGIWCVTLGLADISKTALLKRLRQCLPWMGKRVVLLLLQQKVLFPQPARLRIRLVDASVISQPGSRGTDWRLHLGFDLSYASLVWAKA